MTGKKAMSVHKLRSVWKAELEGTDISYTEKPWSLKKKFFSMRAINPLHKEKFRRKLGEFGY